MHTCFQEQLNGCPQVFVSTVSMESNYDQEVNSAIKTQQCVNGQQNKAYLFSQLVRQVRNPIWWVRKELVFLIIAMLLKAPALQNQVAECGPSLYHLLSHRVK